MWQAWLVMLLSAALLVGCRELGGWRLLGAIAAWLAALWSLIVYSVVVDFTGSGIIEAAWFHLWALDMPLLWQFWPLVLSFTLLVLLSAALLYGGWQLRKRKSTRGQKRYALLLVLLLGLLLKPVWHSFDRLTAYQQELQEIEQLKAEQLNQWQVQSPAKKRNFLYIYVESLSQVFWDEARYPGLMPKLQALLPLAVKVDGIQQLDSTAWTMAGMVASQCGVPLRVFKGWHDNEPPLRCVSDQLVQDGYHLSYIGGARLSFADKGEFLREHQYAERLGLEELQALHDNSLPQSSWGIYDDDLLRITREKLKELQAADKPYGLVMLTLDTHAPRGHATPACRDRHYAAGDKPLLNAVHCADYLVGSFVAELLADPVYKDLTIVVASDHLLMKNADALPVAAAGGANTFLVLNPAREVADVSRPAVPFDIAPSLLHILGYDVSAIGLGRNLFTAEPTLSERFGVESLNRNLGSWLGVFASGSSSQQGSSH